MIPLDLWRVILAGASMYRAAPSACYQGETAHPDDFAPCRCCCDEHTFPDCLARVWGGCRSGLPYGASDNEYRNDAYELFYQEG